MIVHSLNISIKPGTIKNIDNEPTLQNPIILNKNERALEVTKYKKLYLKTVGETSNLSNSQNQEMKNKAREIKTIEMSNIES